jgi:hypothetical protein
MLHNFDYSPNVNNISQIEESENSSFILSDNNYNINQKDIEIANLINNSLNHLQSNN